MFLPTDVAIDNGGNLYIADFGNSRIRKVAQGKIQTVIGGTGTEIIFDEAVATTIRLNGPTGIAVDGSGDIFVAEGSIGTGTGLAEGDYRVWKINSAGVVSTAAGNGMESYSGDGGGATAAQLTIRQRLLSTRRATYMWPIRPIIGCARFRPLESSPPPPARASRDIRATEARRSGRN